ncbi:NAD(P)H-binding protein [Leuconostoc falkenbergense]|uniref:NAD(P)H-binding protein n=1 Tax=Leuconostoc falkenbergense TaxID=2766470 RepID=UPI0024AE6372|nr:NAD(P)H-binding protein [Leuconostoc falkenbergense]MDI6666721.1 NAD(P)H-binding protein [Leuconostoc falkenbergense]
MEKVFVVGATGRVGTQLVAKLLANQNMDVTVGLRNSSKQENSKSSSHDRLHYKLFDLLWDQSAISRVIHGFDYVYFVAGSRGRQLIQVEIYGVLKLITAASESDVKRLIVLSSIFSLEPEHWKDDTLKDIPDYNVAKFVTDYWLIHNANVPYTIIQPSHLTEKPAKGAIEVNVTEDGENTIGDVAETLYQVLFFSNTINKVIKLHSGSRPIYQALKEI